MEVLAMPAIPHFPENYGNSVPTSPRRFVDSPFDFHNHYTSAPTSPTRAAAIYAHFNSITAKTVPKQVSNTTSHVPFDWEVVPGTPKSCSSVVDEETETDTEEEELDFSFDLTRQFVNKQGMLPAITTADELFEEGKIRPLKLPPRLQYPSVDTGGSLASSPRTPRSPVARGLFSPRNRGRRGEEGEFDPFIAAMVEATRDPDSRSRKASRSLSPFRGRSFFSRDSKKSISSDSSSGSETKSISKKWRLKDLLLFRSVSEGRGTGERTTLLSTTSNHSRNGSFQSKDGNMSSMLQNENRYVQRRAMLGEFNKKSSLAYKQSLFGCLRINNICKRIY